MMIKRLNKTTFLKDQQIQEALALPPAPPAQIAPQPTKARIQKNGSITVTAKSADTALWIAINTIAEAKCTYSRECVIGTVDRLKSKNLVKEHNGQFTITLSASQVEAIANFMESVYNKVVSGK